MIMDVHDKDIRQLFATPIVQQTAFWSTVKRKLGASPLAVDFKTRPHCSPAPDGGSGTLSDVLVIIKRIDKEHTYAYVPYGPELEPAEEYQGVFLEELSESLRSYLPKDCILIRYDLCWQSYWAKNVADFDEHGHWKGGPEIAAQETRFNFNTENWNFRKAQFNILPSSTVYLDLRRDAREILEGMKPKTRYNIGLAGRKGVSVRRAGLDSLRLWYALYEKTAARNNLNLNDIRYFEAVLTACPGSSRSPVEVILLVAELDGVPLASMFLILSGGRGSYLYGASSYEHRMFMAPYALQWEAILISKQSGCTAYDMFGVAPRPDSSHPLYGLYKFKTGFGGALHHSLGCWDYPLDHEMYGLFTAAESSVRGLHLPR